MPIGGGAEVHWHCEGNDWCIPQKTVTAQHCIYWVPDSFQIPGSAQVKFFVNGANHRTTSLSCGWRTECRSVSGVQGCTYKVYWQGCGKYDCEGPARNEMTYGSSDLKWCDLYINGAVAIAGRHSGVHFSQGCG